MNYGQHAAYPISGVSSPSAASAAVLGSADGDAAAASDAAAAAFVLQICNYMMYKPNDYHLVLLAINLIS